MKFVGRVSDTYIKPHITNIVPIKKHLNVYTWNDSYRIGDNAFDNYDEAIRNGKKSPAYVGTIQIEVLVEL